MHTTNFSPATNIVQALSETHAIKFQPTEMKSQGYLLVGYVHYHLRSFSEDSIHVLGHTHQSQDMQLSVRSSCHPGIVYRSYFCLQCSKANQTLEVIPYQITTAIYTVEVRNLPMVKHC